MENILVSIRVRPLSKQESAKGNPWKLTPKSIALSSAVSTAGHIYNFDRVFDPNTKTADIYDAHTKKIISSAVQGFNGTIFAYGQTSSGKTFTMRGSTEEPGIIPLAIQDVFRNIEESQNREFLLRVSYMEIYNEEIKDLLAPENCKLQIHENFERGIFVAGLREEIVVGPEQVLELMEYGEAHRHIGETNMNVHSSRSHAIFRMVIESRDKSQDDPSDRELLQNSDPVRVSHLNLVDLAGSERVSKSGAEGTRLKEGTHINKSLMTLGNVINKLSEGIEKQGGHVPYRDSKLTRILQPALGGNARTVIICNITPALVHVDETRGTLHFASRANRVTNCAQVNEIVTDAALLKRQKKEIAELRQKLQNQESPSDQFEEEILNLRNELLKTELERERMALELQEFQKAQAERERRIKEQEQKIENLSTMVINSAVDDRVFEKRSKRNNRRETWCARPQSGLPLGLNLNRPSQKDVPKPASSEVSIKINRERSFGLPPPFETLMEEDEGLMNTFTRGTDFSLDEGLEEEFSIGDGFSLPEPGPQSSVADRRRRSSTEWIMGNEVEQQLLDLQGQYDTLQCDFVLKMNEKNSEIDKLKGELAYSQSTLGRSGKKDKSKTDLDPERRGKSLDGWKDSESIETIKQLRAQVGNLETEKLYMERELQRLSYQARQQSDTSRQELEEVYEELDRAKESSAELNVQLNRTMKQIQQFQMEKCENEAAYSQLSLALKELKSEVDNIRDPSSSLQSSMNESLQILTINVKAFQECLAEAKDLSSPGHPAYEMDTAKLNSLTPKADILKGLGVEYHDPTCLQLDELDEKHGYKEVPDVSSETMGVQPDQDRMITVAKHVLSPEVHGGQLLDSVQEKLHHVDDVNGTPADESGRMAASEQSGELQSGDHKDCEIKHCYSVSAEQKPGIFEDCSMLHEERGTLQADVDNLRMQIEHANAEKQTLLQRKIDLEEELEKLRTSLEIIEEEKSSLSILNTNPVEGSGDLNEPFGTGEKLHCTDSKVPCHENVAECLNWQTQEAETESISGALASANCETEAAAAAEKQAFLHRESVLEGEIETLKSALQLVEEEHKNCPRVFNEAVEELDRQKKAIENLASKLATARSIEPQLVMSEGCDAHHVSSEKSVAEDKLWVLDGEVDWAVGELKSLHETVESLQGAIRQAALEEERLLMREYALSEELHHVKTSLQSVEDENNSLSRKSEEMQSELDRRRAEMHAIASKITSVQNSQNDTEGYVFEDDRLTQDKELQGMVDVLHDSMLQAKKETDRLLSREASFVEEVASLKSCLQTVEDDKKSWMRVSEERLSEIESQKVGLDDAVGKLEFTRIEHLDAQTKILELNSKLSQMLEEQETLKKKLKDVEEDKNSLTRTVAEAGSQLQAFRAGAEDALKEMEGWQERYQSESTQHKAEVISLRKELSTMKALPGSLTKERDNLHKDLEKAKSKMKDIEAKFKTAIQDKSKLETEKVNMDRELKQLRQSTLLQRDINRRDSVVDHRRQSMALGVNKTKHQLTSAEHALQMKTEEVENLTSDLKLSNEMYAKLEFAMTEAEGYSKERLSELEGALANLKDEKDGLTANVERLQNEVEVLSEQCKSKTSEVDNLKDEILVLMEKVNKSEDQRIAAEGLVNSVTKDKEDIVEELLDAHISFQRQKSELLAQAQDNREKCNVLNRDIVLLTEELEKLKKLQEEATDANRVLEDKLQQALEVNSEKSLTHHKLLKDLEVDAASHKDRCRQLEQAAASFEKREHDLRLSGTVQLEEITVELQQIKMKLSTAKDAEYMLSMECRTLLISNTKLQFALDAARGRLDIFETRLDESNWELTEFKSLLQKAGFVKGDEWNLISLQQFERHIKAQFDEARTLERELANKKMEMIELEVQVETMRADCENYEEEIQYMKTKVLSPEQEAGVREMVHHNTTLQAQLEKADHQTQELQELVKAKEVSLSSLQATMGTLQLQNTRLRKDLSATRSELDTVEQLHKLAVRASTIGKSSMSMSKPVRPEKLLPQATAQSTISLPIKFDHISSPSMADSGECMSTKSVIPEFRSPLMENPSPVKLEKKRPRLFPNSERSKLSRSLIGPRSFTFPEPRVRGDSNKENFTVH